MVSEILKQAPDWTAMRCRLLLWEANGDTLVLDAVMSGDQPDNGDWEAEQGSPFTIVIAVPCQGWLATARAAIEGWISSEHGIEVRRTRAWEACGQVLIWGPDASLLVTLAG